MAFWDRLPRCRPPFFVDNEGAQFGSAIVSAQSKDKWVQTIDEMLTEVQE